MCYLSIEGMNKNIKDDKGKIELRKETNIIDEKKSLENNEINNKDKTNSTLGNIKLAAISVIVYIVTVPATLIILTLLAASEVYEKLAEAQANSKDSKEFKEHKEKKEGV
ncbi:MAG: hypothetical protein ACP5LH_03055 [Candidatus Micrarchaeia archaeon]